MNKDYHNTKITRVDKGWDSAVRSIMKTRYDRGLAKLRLDELSPAEFTRLSMRAPSWPKLVEELKTLPKRRE